MAPSLSPYLFSVTITRCSSIVSIVSSSHPPEFALCRNAAPSAQHYHKVSSKGGLVLGFMRGQFNQVLNGGLTNDNAYAMNSGFGSFTRRKIKLRPSAHTNTRKWAGMNWQLHSCTETVGYFCGYSHPRDDASDIEKLISTQMRGTPVVRFHRC